jgi:hypothetical protein
MLSCARVVDQGPQCVDGSDTRIGTRRYVSGRTLGARTPAAGEIGAATPVK